MQFSICTVLVYELVIQFLFGWLLWSWQLQLPQSLAPLAMAIHHRVSYGSRGPLLPPSPLVRSTAFPPPCSVRAHHRAHGRRSLPRAPHLSTPK